VQSLIRSPSAIQSVYRQALVIANNQGLNYCQGYPRQWSSLSWSALLSLEVFMPGIGTCFVTGSLQTRTSYIRRSLTDSHASQPADSRWADDVLALFRKQHWTQLMAQWPRPFCLPRVKLVIVGCEMIWYSFMKVLLIWILVNILRWEQIVQSVKYSRLNIRKLFFTERVVAVWNNHENGV